MTLPGAGHPAVASKPPEAGKGLPEQARTEYDRLLGLAAGIHRMPFRESSAESHVAASEFMIDHADELYGGPGRPASSRLRRHG